MLILVGLRAVWKIQVHFGTPCTNGIWDKNQSFVIFFFVKLSHFKAFIRSCPHRVVFSRKKNPKLLKASWGRHHRWCPQGLQFSKWFMVVYACLDICPYTNFLYNNLCGYCVHNLWNLLTAGVKFWKKNGHGPKMEEPITLPITVAWFHFEKISPIWVLISVSYSI